MNISSSPYFLIAVWFSIISLSILDLSNEAKIKDNRFYSERIVQSQWEKQRRWSKLFLAKKKKIQLAQFAKLFFVSTGAVAQVAATQVPAQYKVTTSFVGGICVGIGAYLKNNFTTKEQVKDMVMNFYISQAIKSEVWKYRAKAGAYAKLSGPKAVQTLKDNCNQFSKLGAFDKRFLMMEMDKKPVPQMCENRDDYSINRIDKIVEKLYLKSARQFERKGAICSRIEDVLLGAGTVAGFGATQSLPPPFSTVVEKVLGWTGALTTISTAFANHHAKMKYEEIANQYYDAAAQLRALKEEWPSGAMKAGDAGWDEQILKCESVILSTVEEFARDRTGNKELKFGKPAPPPKQKFSSKVWNPNVICGSDESGSYKAGERMKWLMENKNLSKKDAQQLIMNENPDNF